MDGSQFDAFSRALSDVRSRRSLGRLVVALPLIGSAAALPWREAASEQHRHKRKKRKKKPASPSPSTPPPPPGPTCAGKLISGRCVLDCGTTCQSKNGLCGVSFEDMNTLVCVPTANNYCVEYPHICTQDAGCAATELCVKTICGPNQSNQGRCFPIFPA